MIRETQRDGPGPDPEQIQLSTIHQAKGLEFDVVFVMMLCDGLFPSSRRSRVPGRGGGTAPFYRSPSPAPRPSYI
ncbi:MAG: hypothetical protein Ct9H300mP7_4210 [Verrucomicrobiota bacterium]|nr:MAG: hypothetical protein Ct9H300mP7_4210 [Verrucomicrobiota bacterium]